MKKALSLLLAMLLVSALVSLFVVPVSAAETGFCAIGEVKNDKAAIILSDGTVKTVTHDGSAVSGKVCSFSAEGGIYTFTEVTFSAYFTWRINDGEGNEGDKTDLYYGNDGVNEYFVHFDVNATTFVKYGETKWAVKNGGTWLAIPQGTGDTQNPNTAWPANIDAVDVNSDNTVDVLFADIPSAIANNYAQPDYGINSGTDGLKIDQIFPAGEAVDVLVSDSPATADHFAMVSVIAAAAVTVAVIPFAKKKHN